MKVDDEAIIHASHPPRTDPCIKCHAVDRYKDGKCKPCTREYRRNNKDISRRYWLKSKEKAKACQRRYRLNNKEKIAARLREYRMKNSEMVASAKRKYVLMKKYGLSLEQQSAMYAACGGKCQICGVNCEPSGSKVAVSKIIVLDHDHKTGKVRGLLCPTCNQTIGLMKDNPQTLRNAADYIERYQ